LSTAFTAVNEENSWQLITGENTTLLDEIVLAYSERRQAAGQSAYTLAGGTNIQSKLFWQELQLGIIDLANNYYLNHVADFNSYAYETLPYWGFTAMMGTLSLTDFRQAYEYPADWTDKADPAYTFDITRKSHIIGPWIFKDLQDALSLLRWVYKDITPSSSGERLISASDADCATAFNASNTQWSAAGWTPGAGYAYIYGYASAAPSYTFDQQRYYNGYSYSVWDGRPASASYWGFALDLGIGGGFSQSLLAWLPCQA
jgi:hypothetical protein